MNGKREAINTKTDVKKLIHSVALKPRPLGRGKNAPLSVSILSKPRPKGRGFEILIRNGLNIMGILDGEYAYKGPDCVQVDLTNNCNNNCIACWCNSPLLGDKAIAPAVKEQTLDHGMVIRLIDRLAKMRAAELYFSGGGEPLMHPGAIDILTYAKSKGFICTLHTNFTLANEDTVKRLKDIKLDHLVISLWTATPQTYVKTHLNKKEEDFIRIKKLLKFLNQTKETFPEVRLYNVIFNLNYREIIQMAEFCLETFSESVEFTVVDTIPERTDQLLLNREQTAELLKMCEIIKDDKKYYDKHGKSVVSNFDQFIRRVSSGHNGEAEYDRGFLDTVPCYVGWIFARVLADGNVNSCLKAHRIPIGNLYEQDFDIIWNGAKQREFRKCLAEKKEGSLFLSMIGNDPDKKIGCYKSCDDLGRNMLMHKKMSRLTPLQAGTLKNLAKLMHSGRALLNGK